MGGGSSSAEARGACLEDAPSVIRADYLAGESKESKESRGSKEGRKSWESKESAERRERGGNEEIARKAWRWSSELLISGDLPLFAEQITGQMLPSSVNMQGRPVFLAEHLQVQSALLQFLVCFLRHFLPAATMLKRDLAGRDARRRWDIQMDQWTIQKGYRGARLPVGSIGKLGGI